MTIGSTLECAGTSGVSDLPFKWGGKHKQSPQAELDPEPPQLKLNLKLKGPEPKGLKPEWPPWKLWWWLCWLSGSMGSSPWSNLVLISAKHKLTCWCNALKRLKWKPVNSWHGGVVHLAHKGSFHLILNVMHFCWKMYLINHFCALF